MRAQMRTSSIARIPLHEFDLAGRSTLSDARVSTLLCGALALSCDLSTVLAGHPLSQCRIGLIALALQNIDVEKLAHAVRWLAES